MDILILDFIQKLRTPFLDAFFKIYTTMGDRAEIWLIIILILFLNKKTRRLSYYALAVIALEVLVVEGILKTIIQRPRPFEGKDWITLLIKPPHGYSLPSGHAASSFAVATLLYLNNVKFKKTIMVLASLMALSRVYLYVHYPSDIILGAILGMILAYFVHYYMNKRLNYKHNAL